jgi:thiopurine S-methyltransferase
MNPSFWLERWEKDQIAFHQESINPYLLAHWRQLDTPRDAAVFVPMCGKSRDMQWLREQGHAVIGVEIARIAVRDFFNGLSLTPEISRVGSLERWEAQGYTLWCGDMFASSPTYLENVAAVFDRTSLVALPAEMRVRYVRHMADIVPPSARTLLVSVTYPQREMKGPPFSVDEREIRALHAHCRVDKLDDVEVLSQAENSRFRERGMTSMSELVYRIERK